MKIVTLSKYSDRDSSARRRAKRLLKLGQAKLTMSNKSILMYELSDDFIIYPRTR